MSELPEWKIPVGLSRSLWTYVQDKRSAHGTNAGHLSSALICQDLKVACRYFDTPGRLIDLGCGTGRLLADFTSRGFELVGVDLSWPMLQHASQKLGVCPDVALIRANLVEMDAIRDRSFDYAACLFSTLGMMEHATHRRAIVEHVFRILKPGGRFLLHVHNRYFHLRTSVGRRWLLRDIWRQLAGAADAGNFEPPAGATGAPTLHHFSLREVRRLLSGAGLQIDFVDPVSLAPNGKLPLQWLLPGLRAYGFHIGASKSS